MRNHNERKMMFVCMCVDGAAFSRTIPGAHKAHLVVATSMSSPTSSHPYNHKRWLCALSLYPRLGSDGLFQAHSVAAFVASRNLLSPLIHHTA